MAISNLTNRSLGYHGFRRLSSFSSRGLPSVSSITYPSNQSSKSLGFTSYGYRYDGYTGQILNFHLFVGFRLYWVPSVNASQYKKLLTDELKSDATSKEVLKLINLVNCDKDNFESKNLNFLNVRLFESKLNFLNLRLSVASVALVFKALNRKKKSALNFFYWIKCRHPDLGLNSDVCSLVIDNCGRLNDYNAMRDLLNDFKKNRVSLNKKAFEYLPIMAATEAKLRECTDRVVDILKNVGGTSYFTGIQSLIEMFSVLGSFNMARFVIEKTERRLCYYNLLIREMCQRHECEGARNLLDEMRQEGCVPTAQIFNNLISSLLNIGENADALKLLQEMKERDCPPDAITFEIFIYHYCQDAKLDIAFEFFAEMKSRGLRPRLSTHAAFIKGFFNLQKYEEAYRYVVDLDDKYSTPANYSLLAGLHDKRGNLIDAENILSEMINKGLRPQIKVYMRVRKHLEKAGKKELAAELQKMFHQLEVRA